MSDEAPNPTPKPTVKNGRFLFLLLVLVISLGLSQVLWRRAFEAGTAVPPPWLAVAAVGIAALALAVGYVFSQRQETAVPSEESLSTTWNLLENIWLPFMRRHWRKLAVLSSALLTLYILFRLPQMPHDARFTGVFLAWMVAGVLYVSAVAESRPRFNWRTLWQEQRPLVIGVIGLGLFAFFLRAWRIGTIPFVLGGDEASQGLEAVRFIKGELRNPFTTGWLGVPTLSFFFNSLTISLLGPTTAALRLPWAFIGAATVLNTFFLVKQLKGARLAWVTAVLFAAYHYHIHFSRLGSNQVADPFFLSLSLLFLYRGLDRESLLDWSLAGAACGLAFYFYAGARLTPVILLAILAYLFIRNPRTFWQKHLSGVLIAVGAFIIVAAPMMQYAYRFPGDFNARLNQVGIIQSGWLTNEVVVSGRSAISILFEQFYRSAFAFNFYPDRTVWYGLRDPLLDSFFGSFFLLGLLYGTVQLLGKRADERLAPMIAWWWGATILGGMLTESPPSSQRLITLAVPVCFLIVIGLWELIQLMQRALDYVPVNALLVVATILFCFSSLVIYFIEFTPQRIYGGPHAELATTIAPRLNELKQDHRFYFVGAPWMYWGFATLPYLVDGGEGIDIIETLTAPPKPQLIQEGKGAVFIFLPERLLELQLVQQTFPDGIQEDIFSPVNGRQMGTLYIVDHP